MDVIFFGSDNFAVPALQALLKSRHRICCVVTQPDKKGGRGMRLIPTPVKEIAAGRVRQIYQPRLLNTPQAADFLKNLCPDLFVVVAYGQIFSKEILGIPGTFSINAHASLLPEYRGAAPINWALINGEGFTGVTIIKMSEKLDAGEIIASRRMPISDEDSAVTLGNSLARAAAELLLESVDRIESGNYSLTAQDEPGVSYAPKLKKNDALIDWSRSPESIRNLIRGCLGWPGAFTHYRGDILKVNKASVRKFVTSSVRRFAGEVLEVSKEGITVAAGEGALIIEELQPQGKKNMSAQEFACGFKIRPGDRLGGTGY